MTRLRRGYGEAGGSRWIGFSRKRSQIVRQRRKNHAAKAAYAANPFRTTRSTPRRRQEFIESFTRTIIARWLRGFLLHCTIRFPDKQRLYARSLIAAATQRGSQNIYGEHAHLKRDFLGMLSACRAFSSLVGYESRSWIRPRLLSKK
jgi:hypothetical protein